jgi:hypothetical protein
VADHWGNAALAAATASSSCASEAREQVPASFSVAGLITSRVSAPATIFPLINNLKSGIAISSSGQKEPPKN